MPTDDRSLKEKGALPRALLLKATQARTDREVLQQSLDAQRDHAFAVDKEHWRTEVLKLTAQRGERIVDVEYVQVELLLALFASENES